MLIGRTAESLRVRRALDLARQGRSDAVVARGPAGVGKTALLRYAEREARGFTVVKAQGVEFESAVPFAGLHELLRPVLPHAAELAESQAECLRAALALASPNAPVTQFATYVAVLGLLAAAAERTPLLCLVDDAHWIDDDSLKALVFAARRLDADAVAFVFAVRTSEAPFHAPGFDELELGPLSHADAARLLVEEGPSLSPDVVARLVLEAGGNPLALIESARGLTEGQRSGREPLLGPALVGRSGEKLFGRRIAALSSSARRALLVAAASHEADVGPVLAAAERLGARPQGLEEAEAAGLLAVSEARVSFPHPLIRSAAYALAPTSERRAAHQALADVLTEDRRAWHLAASAFGPDEHVAQALESAAVTARGRGGFAAAAAMLERAARLSEAPAAGGRRLFLAADAARAAGQGTHAAELLRETATMSTDRGLLVSVEHARGRVELLHGRTAAAQAILLQAADGIAAADADLAATMLAEAAFAAMVSGDGAGAVEIGRRAEILGAAEGGVGRLVAALVGGAALFRGGQVDEGLKRATRAAALAEASVPHGLDPEYLALAAHVLAWIGEYRRARRIVDRVTAQARAAGALGVLPWTLYVSADLDIRTGRWAIARADASEAARIADDTGNAFWRSYALACISVLDAGQGRAEECRTHAAESEAIAVRLGVEPPRKVADARGLLELSLGRPGEAVIQFEAAGGMTARLALADYIEACVRAHRDVPTDALTAIAGTHGSGPAVRGLLQRCRGLVTHGPESESRLADALAAYEDAGMPFGWARTALILGERLRRAGRRVESRTYLRPALDRFTQLEAVPWAARAEQELRASGETAARRDVDARDRLTPQELQVARTVARGATNREAGAQLFLSSKTVEYHLSHVYRKLGVRSRTELARQVVDE